MSAPIKYIPISLFSSNLFTPREHKMKMRPANFIYTQPNFGSCPSNAFRPTKHSSTKVFRGYQEARVDRCHQNANLLMQSLNCTFDNVKV